MDLLFVALGAAIFAIFGLYAMLLRRV